MSSACGRAEWLTTASANYGGMFARGQSYLETAGNYTAPNGRRVRYGYHRAVLGAGVGVVRPDGSFLSFDISQANKRDALYAGAPMDTRRFDATTVALKGRSVLDGDVLKAIRLAASFTDFDRENDNFTYRALVGLPALARFDRKVTRLDGAVELAALGLDWTAGIDLHRDTRDATRFQGAALTAQSRVMPDARVTVLGFNVEALWQATPESRLRAGTRLDLVSASIGDPDASGLVTPGFGATPTPRSLFAQYYGARDLTPTDELNLGGRLRYERDFDGRAGQWYAAVRRHVRTADPRERYFVSFTPPTGAALEPGPVHRTWIRNPLLAPEQHHLGELGFRWSRDGWRVAARGFGDRAFDFILHDRARGQAGILMANDANVFRNVEAFIAGLEALAGYRFANGVFVNGTLNWTYGQNLTDRRPIAQIPPLESSLRFGWSNESWIAESRMRMVATQTRLDAYFRTGSGDDGTGLGVAPGGFTTVDLSLGWKPLPNVTITAGVENLLDRTYAEFIDRNDIDDPFMLNPVAAGRSFFLRASARF